MMNKIKLITAVFCLNSMLFAQINESQLSDLKSKLKSEDLVKQFEDNMVIANYYFNISKFDSSSKYFLDAKIIYEKNKFSTRNDTAINSNLSKLLESMSFSHYYLGNLEAAAKIASEKMIFDSIHFNLYGIVKALTLNGMVESNKGNNTTALDLYLKALSLAPKISDKEVTAQLNNNIGEVYREIGEYDKAIEYYNKALEFSKSTNNTFGIGACYMNIGSLYASISKYDEAIKTIRKVIPVFSESNFKGQLANLYTNLGTVFQRADRLDSALYYKKLGLQKSEEIDDKDGISNGLKAVGFTLIKMEKYDEAIIYLEKGLKLAKDNGIKYTIRECYKGISLANVKKKNFEKGYENYKLYIVYRDSLMNEDNDKKILQMQMQYDYDQKESLLKIEQEKQAALSQEELRIQKILRNTSILGVLLALLVLFFVFRNLRQSKRSNKIIKAQNIEVEYQRQIVIKQKELVEEKQKEILDSIQYAKRIQVTLLAHTDFLNENIPQNFVLYKPKDIVSGDFYWATKKDNLFYLAVCDSTGHGVPGAFMSLLNIGFLSEAINEKNILEPHLVFNYVRDRLIASISKEGQKDGFDGILICINQTTQKVTYASANNAPIIIRDNEIIELAKDKMPVGKGERTESFKLYEVDLKPNDSLYLYTDGYADQFGGPKGKKFLYKRLNELIMSISSDDIYKRGDKLNTKFEEWKGDLEQVDDVLIIGIRA